MTFLTCNGCVNLPFILHGVSSIHRYTEICTLYQCTPPNFPFFWVQQAFISSITQSVQHMLRSFASNSGMNKNAFLPCMQLIGFGGFMVVAGGGAVAVAWGWHVSKKGVATKVLFSKGLLYYRSTSAKGLRLQKVNSTKSLTLQIAIYPNTILPIFLKMWGGGGSGCSIIR